MEHFTSLIIILSMAVSPLLAYQNHSNYSVYRLCPENEEQIKYLSSLKSAGIDFWRGPNRANCVADVMISPADKPRVLEGLNQAGITNAIMIPDVEQKVNHERKQLLKARQNQAIQNESSPTEAIPGFWDTFHQYPQHVDFVDALQRQNPGLVEVYSIGKSYQDRDIKAMRIGIASNSTDNSTKEVIFIQGGIHAREWASPATVTYFAQELINRQNDDTVHALLSKYDFYIVPILNVDGYEYTFTDDRMWRKNLRPAQGSDCIGTDLNRNYDHMWGGSGADHHPCSQIYAGEKPFSEPETTAERDFMVNTIGVKRIRSYVAVHSAAQVWLYPWGYGSDLTPDHDELTAKAIIATEKLKEKYGTRYEYGTTTNVMYPAAGGADGIKYSYTVELRCRAYGFVMPLEEIKPSAEETTDALIAMFDAISKTPVK